ncbi:SLBB domain-containing protein [Thiomicrorhabdus sp. zzn3]|uniref:SLBB domain-containing protein n=1 Tax=Thiomicrorhabdus sp. zzn3 TaxID=3039775 RepID=UPI002436F454|nr:SLBB domain-containing protein [Thiomicrorhabdus sp. zzn3]MDG6777388.1 SLBB domain-containing protein [Thiomicrorhabdus sp. zzn3]
MRFSFRLPTVALWFLVLISWQVHAAVPKLDQDQIDLFKSLPKEQQQKLLDSQGLSSGLLKGNLKQEEATEPFVDTVKPLLTDDEELQDNGVDTVYEVGVQPLKRFGAELFAGQPTTFAPVNDIPVPTDYILGPGDQLKVQLYGAKNNAYELVLDRNGQINFPEIGPVNLAGLSFSEAKSVLIKRIESLGMGVNASITMGELRSFRIFVMGESRTPGSYLVSGMATMTHALYVSGGISEIGSYRNIQLKRKGKLIATLDLYDLLVHGDTQDDARLQPGDTVFIPPAGNLVTLRGEVQRPAIYELKNEKTLADAMRLAGGMKPTALTSGVNITRIEHNGLSVVKSIDLAVSDVRSVELIDGDEVEIKRVSDVLNRVVELNGKVLHPGVYQWSKGLTLGQLLEGYEDFEREADLSYLVILRQKQVGAPYEVVNADWNAIRKGTAADVILWPQDQVFVLDRDDGEARRELVGRILDKLYQQATSENGASIASVSGMVRFPGVYPLGDSDRVNDLIRAAGGLKEQAMLNGTDLVRYDIVDGEKREVERIHFNLMQALKGDEQNNFKLKAYDQLSIKQVSDWSDASHQVTIKGEVRYPGTYTIAPGETLESVLQRAGGFSEWAAPENAIFIREQLKAQEERELQQLAMELEKNLLLAARRDAGIMENNNGPAMIAMGESLIEKIKQTPAIGRLVVGLDPDNPARYASTMKVEMRDKDVLYVPKRSNEVVIMGEVSRTISVIHEEGKRATDYIAMSGGLTKRADSDSIYVVHGDGAIERLELGWFSTDENLEILPGDTIVVPMDVERINPIITWTNVSKILANFAVSAATLKTIGVFD